MKSQLILISRFLDSLEACLSHPFQASEKKVEFVFEMSAIFTGLSFAKTVLCCANRTDKKRIVVKKGYTYILYDGIYEAKT
jgi:hypothetical protein